ncbi:response regulator [Chitinispirillales bacterium ANBcel5]|uniref:response regulator n=1 Tax=Cellulosispirillum alkaliphilum TaxID=3039283 RepID=UPI002A5445FB|nr:response regulator [Chitinispirillales bacterium ANBcel5]
MKTLIAEDDFTSRLLFQELLKGFGITHVAVNGKEAVKAAKIALDNNEPYDLICLDIMMPEMDGHMALSAIRKLEEEKGLYSSDGAKVIMLTALGDLKNVSSAFSELCDAYIVKPIGKDKLINTLNELKLV